MSKTNRTCFVLLNHKPAEEQLVELSKRFGATPVYPSEEHQKLWANIDPFLDVDQVESLVAPLINEISKHDYVWCQGELTATYFIMSVWRVPALIATTRRVVTESNGVKTSTFQHVQFRVI